MAPRLDRRTVVVTRGKGGEDALALRLRALGAEVREVASIAFADPVDPAPLDAALRGLGAFEWVVFTSATAIERTVARMAVLGVPVAALATRRLAAVGPATADRLARLVREPDLVPAEARGAAMAAALGAHVAGRAVLFPRPAEGRPETVEALVAAGARLTSVEAYRTVPAPHETIAPLGDWLARGEVDAVAFASPSAVRSVVSALGARADLLRHALLAAIGPTTARVLRDAGLPVGAEPARYTGPDLADAIAAALGPG